jgi:hypothetical protein
MLMVIPILTLYPFIFQRSDIGGGHVNRTLDVPISLIIISDMKPGSERLEYISKINKCNRFS